MQRFIKTMVVSPSFSARQAVSSGGFVKSVMVWDVSVGVLVVFVSVFVFVLLVLFVVLVSAGDVVSVVVLVFEVSVEGLFVDESSSEQAANNNDAQDTIHRIKNDFNAFGCI